MRKRDFGILLLALAAAAILGTVILKGCVRETVSWGLSFRQEGAPPLGTAGAEALGALDAAYLGNTAEKIIYLTFDAGYENGCTEKILDVLKKHEVPAAFFLVGNYMERNADLVRRMAEEGHTVGNHTMHHPDMSQLTEKAAFESELTGLEELFLETTGKDLPKYYRPPPGIYSEENLKMAQELGKRCHVAAVKCGAAGSWICRDNALTAIAIEPVRAVDTTAAGDTWAAGYLYGYWNGQIGRAHV